MVINVFAGIFSTGGGAASRPRAQRRQRVEQGVDLVGGVVAVRRDADAGGAGGRRRCRPRPSRSAERDAGRRRSRRKRHDARLDVLARAVARRPRSRAPRRPSASRSVRASTWAAMRVDPGLGQHVRSRSPARARRAGWACRPRSARRRARAAGRSRGKSQMSATERQPGRRSATRSSSAARSHRKRDALGRQQPLRRRRRRSRRRRPPSTSSGNAPRPWIASTTNSAPRGVRDLGQRGQIVAVAVVEATHETATRRVRGESARRSASGVMRSRGASSWRDGHAARAQREPGVGVGAELVRADDDLVAGTQVEPLREDRRAVAGVAQQRDLLAPPADERGDARAVRRQLGLARPDAGTAPRGVVVDHGVQRVARRERQHADRRVVEVDQPRRERERRARERRRARASTQGVRVDADVGFASARGRS